MDNNNQTVTNDRLPPLPTLQGEVLLEIYTHKSLGKLVANLKDNERYVVLGTKAFELAITQCVFKQHPDFTAKEIEDEVRKLISDENFEIWASHYKLREKLRYNPTEKDSIFTPDGARETFLAYIGGIYDQSNGLSVLLTWVTNAFFPSAPKVPEHDLGETDSECTQSTFVNSLYANGQCRVDADSPPMLPFHKPRPTIPDILPSHFSEPPRSIYRRDIPPHMINNNNNFITRPTVAFLPKFNEITTRRRLDVQWMAEQTGVQHAPLWSISCIVNGHVYGSGTGSTKQLAKEEAAREAYTALKLDTM